MKRSLLAIGAVVALFTLFSCSKKSGDSHKTGPDGPNIVIPELPEGAVDIALINSQAAGLSKKETANCYVLNEAGIYAFPANVRGNGVPAGGLNAGISGIASASIVWDRGNILKSAHFHIGKSGQPYVIIETPETFAKGNALVAIKDIEGSILWSWHIWATSYIPGKDDKLIGDSNGCWNYMPLELGMTGLDDSSCMLYQWGRKDPFPTVTPEKTTYSQMTMAQAISQPDCFFVNDASMYCSNGSVALWNPGNDAKKTVKTMLDPCPPGYYIMPYDAAKVALYNGITSCIPSSSVNMSTGLNIRFHEIIYGGMLCNNFDFYWQHSYWQADNIVSTGRGGTARVNRDGGGATLDNYGGVGIGFPVRGVRKGRFKAAFMGDSITQFWREESNGDPAFFVSNGFLNKGIAGETTTQILARFDTDIVAYNPEKVVILAGTNDLAGNDNGGVPRSSEHILGNISAMAQKAIAGGASEVLLCSVLPVSQYNWNPGINPMPLIKELNIKLKAYCAATPSCTYVDYYSAWINEAGTGAKEGLTYDNTHPTRSGYTVLEGIILPYLK